MGTKLWDNRTYFRSTEMYTAKRSHENEFRSQHCLYPAKRTAITRLHNVMGAYIQKPIKLRSGKLLGLKLLVTVKNVTVHL